MKKLTIGFSKSKKTFPIASWLIMLYQWTKFSHVYIRLETPFLGSDTITHASEGKILRMSDEQFNKRHKVIEEIEILVDDNAYKSMILELHKASGDDYGLMQNLGIIIVDFFNLLNIKIKNPFQSGWNCSEFVYVMLRNLDPKITKKEDPQTITPKQVYKLLKSLK